MKIHFDIEVQGRVQGVGFRYFTHKKAIEIGVFGFVKNLSNGNVYIEAEADEIEMQTFLNLLEKGPSFGRTDRIQKQESPIQNFTSFEIR